MSANPPPVATVRIITDVETGDIQAISDNPVELFIINIQDITTLPNDPLAVPALPWVPVSCDSNTDADERYRIMLDHIQEMMNDATVLD